MNAPRFIRNPDPIAAPIMGSCYAATAARENALARARDKNLINDDDARRKMIGKRGDYPAWLAFLPDHPFTTPQARVSWACGGSTASSRIDILHNKGFIKMAGSADRGYLWAKVTL